mgnify:CR=1 FL=1
MTEQQPQEPYGDPQYESYREGTPTESVPTISMPTESIPITGASGPDRSITAAPGTTTAHPIRILFSHAASHIRAVCARPFPDS